MRAMPGWACGSVGDWARRGLPVLPHRGLRSVRRRAEMAFMRGMPHGSICGEDFDWKRREDEPQDNEIANCYVHHTGEMDWGAYGILSSYCRRNRIAHNLIEQQPYCPSPPVSHCSRFPPGRTAEVTVEYNHIHHVLQKLFDGGGIYVKDGVRQHRPFAET